MSELGKVYTIRNGKTDDIPFIMSTWLRGLYYGNEFFGIMPKDIFMDNYKHICEALINKSTIKVACLIEDEDVILGYAILSPDLTTLHWAFVKNAFRNKGISKDLLPKYFSVFTHFSTLGLSLVKKYVDLTFNPFSV